MKYREYMEEHPEENVTWCKPYTDDKGNALVMWEGEPLVILMDDGREYWRGKYDWEYREQNRLDDQAVEAFARHLDPDYSPARGYTDTQIILQNLRECGCASCPFREECELMDEEIEE